MIFIKFVAKYISMKDLSKAAYARLVTELLKADKVIAQQEIETIEELFRQNEILPVDIDVASTLTIGQASKIIAKRKRKAMLMLSDLKSMALADGSCSREESLLLTALDYCVGTCAHPDNCLVSFRCAELDFADSQVLFLDGTLGNLNESVVEQCRHEMGNELRMGGFEFIFIPDIARHYRNTPAPLVKKIVAYMAPMLTPVESQRVIDMLGNLSTKSFRNEILETKLRFKLEQSNPVLMIKLGNSYVDGVKYSDFLLLDISSSPIDVVREFVGRFNDYQRHASVIIRNMRDEKGNFIYAGFYKTIFDMVVHKRGARCKLVLEHTHRCYRLKFEGPETEIIGELDASHAAMYLLIVAESLSKRNGFRFQNSRRTELQTKYEQIYELLSDRDKVPDITKATNRRPKISHIEACLGPNHVYQMRSNRESLVVDIEPRLVIVRENNREQLAFEHADWARIFS